MAGRVELIEAVRRAVPGITRRQAEALVAALFAAVAVCLERGETVRVGGFGSFSVSERASRKGRNPATGSAVTIPAGRSVRFKPARTLRQQLERRSSPALEEPRLRSVARDLGEESYSVPAEPPSRSGRWERPRTFDPFDDPVRSPAEADEVCATVEVFYATDRKPTGRREPERFFGDEWDEGGLHYGTCRVTIPLQGRPMGTLPAPSIWRLEFRPNPAKHVILVAVEASPRDAFFAELRRRVAGSEGRQALVFVHGFNVTFKDAARRAAQLAWDLEFPGPPALYSWPSAGRIDPLSYLRDSEVVRHTRAHLVAFLEEVAAKSGAEQIHLIAHSMGNRVLTEALRTIALGMPPGSAPHFHEVILTAPDIAVGEFRQLAAEMRRASRRVTLYASANDKALRASQRINGFPRAGDAGANLVVLGGVETIDASEADTDLFSLGHSVFATRRSILADLFHVLRGEPVDLRFGLRRLLLGELPYWSVVP